MVEVVAKDYSFEVVEQIPSGWNTFRLKNAGHAEHFFLLNLLPDTVSFQNYVDQVTTPFQTVFNSIKAGTSKVEAARMLGELVPEWYFTSVKQMGGTGIINPGKTAQVSLKLVPGTYAMECYIKEQGVFHTTLGMINSLKVQEESKGSPPDYANFRITLANDSIQTQGKIVSGENTISVYFKEHPDAGLGNDVHVIRMTDTTRIDSVIAWMNWMNVNGLQSPAPAEFLGGTQEMPVGYTSYFTIMLEPGEYALLSETATARNLVKIFSVN
jgi:hypothetical protein